MRKMLAELFYQYLSRIPICHTLPHFKSSLEVESCDRLERFISFIFFNIFFNIFFMKDLTCAGTSHLVILPVIDMTYQHEDILNVGTYYPDYITHRSIFCRMI